MSVPVEFADGPMKGVELQATYDDFEESKNVEVRDVGGVIHTYFLNKELKTFTFVSTDATRTHEAFDFGLALLTNRILESSDPLAKKAELLAMMDKSLTNPKRTRVQNATGENLRYRISQIEV